MTGSTKYERICHPTLAIVSVAINLPPVVFGLIGTAHWCEYYSKWMLINAVLCTLNIFAAYFSIYKLRKKVEFDIHYNSDDHPAEEQQRHTTTSVADDCQPQENPKKQSTTTRGDTKSTLHAEGSCNDVEQAQPEQQEAEPNLQATSTNGQGDSQLQRRQESEQYRHSCFKRILKLRTTSSNRIRHLVCYNGIITTYAILFLFWAFWLGDGAQQIQLNDVASEEDLNGCVMNESITKTHHDFVETSVVLGFAYFGFVLFCLLASYLDPE
jgi:hypothetical protein